MLEFSGGLGKKASKKAFALPSFMLTLLTIPSVPAMYLECGDPGVAAISSQVLDISVCCPDVICCHTLQVVHLVFLFGLNNGYAKLIMQAPEFPL